MTIKIVMNMEISMMIVIRIIENDMIAESYDRDDKKQTKGE